MADIVEGLLTAPQLAIEKADVIWRALRAFRESKADFSDAVIVELGRDAGCARQSPLTVKPPLIRDSRHFAEPLLGHYLRQPNE